MKSLGLALFALVTLAWPAVAEKTELKGAAILDHPATKVALENMALMKAGKVDEAVKLGTKALQAEWKAMPDEERQMMSEMMTAFAVGDAELRADITKFGVLSIDGDRAWLRIQKNTKDETGESTQTTTLRMMMEDGVWRMTKEKK